MGNHWRNLHEQEESGHAIPAIAVLIGGIGAVLLGIGAANDTGWLAIVGGIAAGVGIIGGGLAEHMFVDYDIFRRLNRAEGNQQE
ncbi:MAG: hypothetical protein U5Q44_04090 [Dehalococcoidia bacterium]|nr:hypothetical protein [Dehalococcoidia bacterium]